MKLPIIYFSSSGNTKYICEIVAEGLKSSKIETELIPLKKLKRYPNIIKDSVSFGVGSPVYGCNFTPNIIDWMNKIPRTKKNKKFFLIDTNAGLSGGAILKAKNILIKKGYKWIGGLEISVPTMDSVFWFDFFNQISWSKDKIKRAFYFGKKIARKIKNGKGDIIKDFRIMPFGKVLSNLFSYVERPFFSFATKLMVFNPVRCTKCKLCESICPTQAINIKKNIYFNPKKCIFCFKCMRNCPTGSLYIRIYPKTKFFKGPYQIKGYIKPEEFELK